MIADVQIFEEIPFGWKMLTGATTAPFGYEFISNGKSRFSKEYRQGLVKCAPTIPKARAVLSTTVSTPKSTPATQAKPERTSGMRFSDEPELPERLNRLAREETKFRLLRDIAADITICQLEGWDYKDYLRELQSEIQRFLDAGDTPPAIS